MYLPRNIQPSDIFYTKIKVGGHVIGLEFDVLTPKLPCLTPFSHLIFETNVVERVNSGQISPVLTCTADCTCHHLTIPAKN